MEFIHHPVTHYYLNVGGHLFTTVAVYQLLWGLIVLWLSQIHRAVYVVYHMIPSKEIIQAHKPTREVGSIKSKFLTNYPLLNIKVSFTVSHLYIYNFKKEFRLSL